MSWGVRLLALVAALWVSAGCIATLLSLTQADWVPSVAHQMAEGLNTLQGFVLWIGLPALGCLFVQLRRIQNGLATV